VAAGKGRRTARVIIKCLVIITAVEVICFFFRAATAAFASADGQVGLRWSLLR